jgi:hypothetical protein
MKTAIDVVKQLDGLSIDQAKRVLEEAMMLLGSTQIVSAESPLLNRRAENPDVQQSRCAHRSST